MGCIIKNRAGSLERVKLERLFAEGMNVHLRVLSCALEIIENEDEQKAAFDFILKRLRKIIEEKKEGNIELSENQLKKHAKIIFWNMNFLIVCGIIYKIVQSLGSNKLTQIMSKVCDEVNTPASVLVKTRNFNDVQKKSTN